MEGYSFQPAAGTCLFSPDACLSARPLVINLSWGMLGAIWSRTWPGSEQPPHDNVEMQGVAPLRMMAWVPPPSSAATCKVVAPVLPHPFRCQSLPDDGRCQDDGCGRSWTMVLHHRSWFDLGQHQLPPNAAPLQDDTCRSAASSFMVWSLLAPASTKIMK